jgi:hypothetical protein
LEKQGVFVGKCKEKKGFFPNFVVRMKGKMREMQNKFAGSSRKIRRITAKSVSLRRNLKELT